jgi:hypothetical protein
MRRTKASRFENDPNGSSAKSTADSQNADMLNLGDFVGAGARRSAARPARPFSVRATQNGTCSHHEAFRFPLWIRAIRAFDFMIVRNARALAAFAISASLRSGAGSTSTRRAGNRLTEHAAFSQTQPGIIPWSNRKRSLNSIIPPHCGQHFVSPFTGRVESRRSDRRS